MGATIALKAVACLSLLSNVVNAGYAPIDATCPTNALIRPADGLSSEEEIYRSQRKPIADAALKEWLAKTNHEFELHSTLPTVSLYEIYPCSSEIPLEGVC
jgi:lysophospholipase